VLADSGVAIPGFQQILWGRLPRNHFYAVYRLSDAHADSATFSRAYRAALEHYEARRSESRPALLFVAFQMLRIGDPAGALARLDQLERAGVQDARVEKLRSEALLQLGNLEGAAIACQRSMQLDTPTAWHWGRLGDICYMQRRFQESRDCFTRAVAIEPASINYLGALGRAHAALGDYAAAAAAFDRCVRLAPRDVEVRRFAIGAWRMAGNEAKARALYDEGVQAGLSAAALSGGVEKVR